MTSEQSSGSSEADRYVVEPPPAPAVPRVAPAAPRVNQGQPVASTSPDAGPDPVDLAAPASPSATAPAVNPPRWSGRKTAIAAALAIGFTSVGTAAAAAALPQGTGADTGGPGGRGPGRFGPRMPGQDGQGGQFGGPQGQQGQVLQGPSGTQGQLPQLPQGQQGQSDGSTAGTQFDPTSGVGADTRT